MVVKTKPLKILVIPDSHLKPRIFDRADAILESGQADYAVCLGDYVDDWDEGLNEESYRRQLERILKFSYDHPDTVWLLGNHDFAYIWNDVSCTGHSIYMDELVKEYLRKLSINCKGLKTICKIGKCVFSHAGLTEEYVNKYHKGSSIDSIINEINQIALSEEYHRRLWSDDSPLWARPQYDDVTMFKKDEFVHVTGHTPMEKIELKDGYLSTDAFSTYDLPPLYPAIGEKKFAIVNCSDGTWEYATE